jgi:hypothetical protein
MHEGPADSEANKAISRVERNAPVRIVVLGFNDSLAVLLG